MKKAFLFAVLFFAIWVACFSQNKPVTLDEALSKSIDYLKTRIPGGSKLVVLNFSSNASALSEYIIEELTGYIVNDNSLTVVDRQNLEIIRKEMEYQLSGEVSDETAQSIGQKLGAQTIISGSITAIGAAYRMRIRAIAVETAAIQGMYNITVAQDSTIVALTGPANQQKNEKEIDYSGIYVVRNKNGLALDVYDNETGNGVPIIVWSNHGGRNQQFRFERLNDGSYKITNIHSGKVIDVSGGISKENGTKILQWAYGGGQSQQWRVIKCDNHYVKIVNVNSRKCLNVPGSSGSGTQLNQWEDNGTDAQRFELATVN